MKRIFSQSPERSAKGFTLVEILVSTALVVAIMALLLNTVDQTQKIWMRSRSKATQFQAARNAFEAMSRRMSQATLNTYWKAHDVNIDATSGNFRFRRQGEFQFVSGPTTRFFTAAPSSVEGLNEPVDDCYPTHAVFFHAPLGSTDLTHTENKEEVRVFRALDSMMNACGYFIEFGDDPDRPRFFRDMQPKYPERNRYRLMEMTVPAERLNIYYRPKDNPVLSDPRIFAEDLTYYTGMVDVSRNSQSFVRPLWMKEAFRRETVPSSSGKYRFKYARVMAENIVGMIILPKLAERDRRTSSGQADPKALELAPSFEFDTWRVLAGGTATPLGVKGPNPAADNRARDNLLPPIVQVVMVAIDEPTAVRLNLQAGNLPKWFKGRFLRASTTDEFDQDLKDMTDAIRNDREFPNATFRIFTTDVVIRGSKWSRDPSS
jgi:uncharacterized protein (TIGR02599 family)